MKHNDRLLPVLILSLALVGTGCAAAPQAAVAPTPIPVTASPADDIPLPEDEACISCELPEIEPLPEGYSLSPENAADIPEEADRADLCPPLGEGDAETAPPNEPGLYRQLSYEEAKAWMDGDASVIVVDVRTKEEYEAGHIPGAVLIPNETIEGFPPEELPDKGAPILIYCRSGNRSYQASLKLLEMGYDFIYDFGGINDWPYEIVTGA